VNIILKNHYMLIGKHGCLQKFSQGAQGWHLAYYYQVADDQWRNWQGAGWQTASTWQAKCKIRSLT